MEIRKGTLKDLEAIAAVEAACFPAAEAATAEEFAGRLQQYGDQFLAAVGGGKAAGLCGRLLHRLAGPDR